MDKYKSTIKKIETAYKDRKNEVVLNTKDIINIYNLIKALKIIGE